MLYYIYVLSGPLKGIITPLLPNQYSLILHSKEHIENKIENEKWRIEKRSFFICARLLAFIDYARDF
ncbi:hypothetical protein LOS07_12590, partial [Proteus mirabilis]|nr:hypothetical protein [Proteus mirabilis]